MCITKNEIKLQALGFRNEIFRILSHPPNILQLNLRWFRPLIMLCENSCKINNLHPCRSTRGVYSDFYRWNALLVLGCQKNTFIDLSPVISIPKLRRISGRTVRNRLCAHCVHFTDPVFRYHYCLSNVGHSCSGRKTTRDADLYSGKLYSSPMYRVFILMAVTDDKGSIVDELHELHTQAVLYQRLLTDPPRISAIFNPKRWSQWDQFLTTSKGGLSLDPVGINGYFEFFTVYFTHEITK